VVTPQGLIQKDSTFCIHRYIVNVCVLYGFQLSFNHFHRIRTESGPGLCKHTVFRLRSGRLGAEIPQGPVAGQSYKFGVGG
jgi:hypothetical protein